METIVLLACFAGLYLCFKLISKCLAGIFGGAEGAEWRRIEREQEATERLAARRAKHRAKARRQPRPGRSARRLRTGKASFLGDRDQDNEQPNGC
jgi:hypothetical protein